MSAPGPIAALYNALRKRSPPPFDWIVEWGTEPTIERAWQAEARLREPDHNAMLQVLQMLRSSPGDQRCLKAMEAVARAQIAELRAAGDKPAANTLDVYIKMVTRMPDQDRIESFAASLVAVRTTTGRRIRARQDAARVIVETIPAPTVVEILEVSRP